LQPQGIAGYLRNNWQEPWPGLLIVDLQSGQPAQQEEFSGVVVQPL